MGAVGAGGGGLYPYTYLMFRLKNEHVYCFSMVIKLSFLKVIRGFIRSLILKYHGINRCIYKLIQMRMIIKKMKKKKACSLLRLFI